MRLQGASVHHDAAVLALAVNDADGMLCRERADRRDWQCAPACWAATPSQLQPVSAGQFKPPELKESNTEPDCQLDGQPQHSVEQSTQRAGPPLSPTLIEQRHRTVIERSGRMKTRIEHRTARPIEDSAVDCADGLRCCEGGSGLCHSAPRAVSHNDGRRVWCRCRRGAWSHILASTRSSARHEGSWAVTVHTPSAPACAQSTCKHYSMQSRCVGCPVG